jgi:hypothetical protein
MKTARRKFAKEQKQDLPVETNRFNENATQSSGECAGFLDRPDPYTLPSDAEERPQVSLGLTVDMSLIYGRSRCFKTPQVDNKAGFRAPRGTTLGFAMQGSTHCNRDTNTWRLSF